MADKTSEIKVKVTPEDLPALAAAVQESVQAGASAGSAGLGASMSAARANASAGGNASSAAGAAQRSTSSNSRGSAIPNPGPQGSARIPNHASGGAPAEMIAGSSGARFTGWKRTSGIDPYPSPALPLSAREQRGLVSGEQRELRDLGAAQSILARSESRINMSDRRMDRIDDRRDILQDKMEMMSADRRINQSYKSMQSSYSDAKSLMQSIGDDQKPTPGRLAAINRANRIYNKQNQDIDILQAKEVPGINEGSSLSEIDEAKHQLRLAGIRNRIANQKAMQQKKLDALNPIEKTIVGDVLKMGGYEPTLTGGYDDLKNYGASSPWSALLTPGYANSADFQARMAAKGAYQLVSQNSPFGGQAPGPGGMGLPPPPPTTSWNDPNSYAPFAWNQPPSIRGGIRSFFDNIPGVTTAGWTGRWLKGSAAEVGRYIGQEAQLAEQENLTGRRNLGGQAQALGGLVGGIVGAGIGSLFPGFGTFIGAGIGSQAGGQVGSFLISKQLSDISRQEALQPMGAMMANYAGNIGSFVPHQPGNNPSSDIGSVAGGPQGRDWVNPALPLMKKWSDFIGDVNQGHAADIGRRNWGDAKDPNAYKDRYMDPDQMARTYGTAYSALIESGLDPERMVNNGLGDRTNIGHRGDDAIRQGEDAFRKTGGFGLIRKEVGIAEIAIGNELNFKDRNKEGTMVPLFQALADNAAARWGKAGEAIFDKQIAPILSTFNQTGGNTADILMKYGVGATNNFIQDLTLLGHKPSVDLKTLMGVQRDIQTMNRDMEFSVTHPQGQGQRAVSALSYEQETISRIPGGKDSLVYAQLGERKRLAGFQANREADIMSYDLPMASLEGQEQRRQFLPNMPGYGLKLSLERMGMRAPYIAQRQKRYAAQVATGQLTEEEQLQQYQQIEGLKTEQARDLGMLAEGGQDRMLAFSGGRPSFFSRMDSVSLARTALWRSGSPQVGSGARNGNQLAYQNDFFRQFSTDGFDPLKAMSPHDRGGYQNGPQVQTAKDAAILSRIAEILQRILNGQGGSTSLSKNPANGISSNTNYGNQRANQMVAYLDPSATRNRGV